MQIDETVHGYPVGRRCGSPDRQVGDPGSPSQTRTTLGQPPLVAAGRPRYEYANEFGSYWRYERLLLPLINSSGVVNMLFGGIDIQLPTTLPWKTRVFSHPTKAKR
jgi:hypothetical protein